MALKEKKFFTKLSQYFDDKKIPFNYDIEDMKLDFELFFEKNKYIIYPYISYSNGICSININISQNNIKNYNYDLLNKLNKESLYFKGYLLDNGLLCLEYRFIINEIDNIVFDKIIESIYMIEDLINDL